MSVLVTGGAGYIGSHTVRALRGEGTDVVVLDTLEYGHREAVLDAPVEVGDVADADLVRRVVEQYGVDQVVHFAGYKAAGESMAMPERYFDNNVMRTARFLDTLRQAGVARFVFSSSAAVYGTPRQLPVDEDHITVPESPYGESKLMVEQMLRWYSACHGMRSVSLRYFNAAGASADARLGEDSHTPLNLVPVAMTAALGQIPRSPCTAPTTPLPTAAASATTSTWRTSPTGTSSRSATSKTVATPRSSTSGPVRARRCWRWSPRPSARAASTSPFGSSRAGPATRPSCSPTTPVRAKLLGWKAKHGLDDIVRSVWNWHSTHPKGFRS